MEPKMTAAYFNRLSNAAHSLDYLVHPTQKLLKLIKISDCDYFQLFMVQFGMLLKPLLTQVSHIHKKYI
jgi:hypothetical protein